MAGRKRMGTEIPSEKLRWFKYVDDPNDGYSDKSLTTVPLVAYTATDKSTYKKVRVHFGYTED